VPACPYKKTFYNWSAGKSEKCILCFPRLEAGQASACFHSCVGRIRYLGVLLYDAQRIHEIAAAAPDALLEAQRSLILDPFDPGVMATARQNGVPDAVLDAARRSPVFKFVKRWKLALPAHPEFRTLPMLFYVPPFSPVMAAAAGTGAMENIADGFFHDIDAARVPVRYLAALLAGGDERAVRYALRKQKAVRWHRRAETVGDTDAATAQRMLDEADCSVEDADAIYRLTSLATLEDRFVVPPPFREGAIETSEDPLGAKQSAGFGFLSGPHRG
jgi:nitrate reductase beta subunit